MDEAGLYAEVGRKVRKLREGRGLTQKALASLVGLTRTSITNIERGSQKVLLHTFVELAHALQVPAADLLGQCESAGGEPKEWDELLKGRPRIEQEWIRAALDPTRKDR